MHSGSSADGVFKLACPPLSIVIWVQGRSHCYFVPQFSTWGQVGPWWCAQTQAFDTVDHVILLRKLENLGAGCTELAWFRHYLQGRKQSVFIDGVTSAEATMSCGVPQSSVLGTLLFLIFINDAPRGFKDLLTILFADDTTLQMSNQDAKT